MKKRIILLGATGSIGKNSLEVIRQLPDEFEIVGITAHSNRSALEQIAAEFKVPNTALSGHDRNGYDAILDLIRDTDADIVINGISGAAGLMPSVVSLESGKDLALANKETVVIAGHLISDLAGRMDCRIQPVDSEHAAIFQLTRFRPENHLTHILLTSSGGPFRTATLEQMEHATIEDALKHPTWAMGSKISIDSATLANKGLEVIETVHLFGVQPEQIEVLIHPQSYVHSLIRTTDGSQYAQISKPDMKVPIMNALLYPEIGNHLFNSFSLKGAVLEFFDPDLERFPMLCYAYDVLALGGSYSIAYNGANEMAVEAFIQKRIPFMGIPAMVHEVLQHDWSMTPETFSHVLAVDADVRRLSADYLETL